MKNDRRIPSEPNRISLACGALACLLTAACATGTSGCGTTTCERIAADREKFFSRPVGGVGPHLEAVLPFAMANGLIDEQVKKVDPIEVGIPGLGKVGSYLGDLSIDPAGAELIPAAADHVRFRLDFDVRLDGKRAFTLSAEVEVEPEIDLERGIARIGFTPEMLEEVEPSLSKDAERELGGLIYSRIPKLARMVIPREAVDSAASRAVTHLAERFYEKSKKHLLPRLGKLSRFSLELPPVPLEKIELSSFEGGGGGLRLLVTTRLPVDKGLDPQALDPARLPRDLISLRASAAAIAELVNWAIAAELVPARYDREGKPKKNGELRPGLAWVPGKRPMRIYLWDLKKPCMRIEMRAAAAVKKENGELRIEALEAEIEGVEASAFTRAGMWFYALWKDALDVTRKTEAKIEFDLAGKPMRAEVEQARLEADELVMRIGLTPAPRALENEVSIAGE
ncbi:MAG: hypothetical protein R6V85_14565 [Polyangia bacterium]